MTNTSKLDNKTTICTFILPMWLSKWYIANATGLGFSETCLANGLNIGSFIERFKKDLRVLPMEVGEGRKLLMDSKLLPPGEKERKLFFPESSIFCLRQRGLVAPKLQASKMMGTGVLIERWRAGPHGLGREDSYGFETIAMWKEAMLLTWGSSLELSCLVLSCPVYWLFCIDWSFGCLFFSCQTEGVDKEKAREEGEL